MHFTGVKPDKNIAPQQLPSMKGMFPFRLGTTSYIIPDDLVPNAEFLCELVDDIELVLFESDEISNLPDAVVIEKLAKLKRARKLTYTVHLPLDIQLGSPEEAVRRRSVEKCLRVMAITEPLAPFAYIVHFHGEMRGRTPSYNIEKWTEALDSSTRELLAARIAPETLCIETLDYPFEIIAPIVFRYGLSICLDVGHLAFYGYPIRKYLEEYLSYSRVIHLHGNSDNADHKDIGTLDRGIIEILIKLLSRPGGGERVLTLEVFGLSDFEKSIETLWKLNE